MVPAFLFSFLVIGLSFIGFGLVTAAFAFMAFVGGVDPVPEEKDIRVGVYEKLGAGVDECIGVLLLEQQYHLPIPQHSYRH
jgi:hypothetical protein